jgi:hypothetical protein
LEPALKLRHILSKSSQRLDFPRSKLSLPAALKVSWVVESEIEKLIGLQEQKVNNYQSKIRKVEEGFEGGFYTLEEARSKKKKYLEAINEVKTEINVIKKQRDVNSFTPDNVERLRLELKNLQDRNLAEASFEERLELVARLGIKVYPSEDLKSGRIACGLNIKGIGNEEGQDGSTKVVSGRPCRSRTCDHLIKSQRLRRQIRDSVKRHK